jgi:hypothetical protein
MKESRQPHVERSLLRQVILDAETARHNLADAHSAARKAEDHVYDTKHRLAALREDEAKAGYPDFISKLAAGADVDVLALDRPAAECRSRIDTAEQEVAAWRRVHEAAKAAVNDRERHVPILEHKVSESARDVIRNSEAVARLMDGLAEMQVEVGRRRAALHFLMSKQLLPEAAKESVARILRADFDSHLDTEWQSAFDELKRDADAPLPVGDSL